MKKIISILLCVCMAVGIMSAAYAADSGDMQKVLETVKSRIGSTDEYDKFLSESTTNDDGTTVYFFTWENTENNAELSVSATAGGIILSYALYDAAVGEDIPISQKASKQELKAAAEGFIKQLNPDICEELSVENMYADRGSARAEIAMYKNGFRLRDFFFGGSIQIDAAGKKLMHFNINYPLGAKFETGDTISKDEAAASFKEKLGAELYYSVDYDWETDEKTITPKYRFKDDGKYISAVSGEVITPERFRLIGGKGGGEQYAGASNEAAMDKSFSEAELKEIENIEGLIKPEAAFEIVKNIKCADVPDVKFEDVSKSLYTDYSDDRRTYSFNYHKENDDYMEYFSASVNAESGEVLSFQSYKYKYDRAEEKKPEISAEKAAQIADEAIKELAPEKRSEYKLASSEDSTCIYDRYVNGIPVDVDGLYLAIDPETEKIAGYRINYTEGEFPDISGVISKSEAEDVFINELGYDIGYVYDSEDEEYKLCYTFSDDAAALDAFTGKLDIHENHTVDAYTDVSGHYAEEAVNSLADFGIGFAGGVLKPDEPIKQKEFAALVLSAIKYGTTDVLYDDYDYEQLYDAFDFIAPEEVNPDGNVTRLDAAKFSVRAMGYIDIAKLDIFKPLFSDVTHDIGYVNLLAGMNIMSGDENGNFNPDSVLTRAQALIIIYNYLNR